MQAQHLKTFAERFHVVSGHFHPCHPWQKTLVNRFTKLVLYLVFVISFYVNVITGFSKRYKREQNPCENAALKSTR